MLRVLTAALGIVISCEVKDNLESIGGKLISNKNYLILINKKSQLTLFFLYSVCRFLSIFANNGKINPSPNRTITVKMFISN